MQKSVRREPCSNRTVALCKIPKRADQALCRHLNIFVTGGLPWPGLQDEARWLRCILAFHVSPHGSISSQLGPRTLAIDEIVQKRRIRGDAPIEACKFIRYLTGRPRARCCVRRNWPRPPYAGDRPHVLLHPESTARRLKIEEAAIARKSAITAFEDEISHTARYLGGEPVGEALVDLIDFSVLLRWQRVLDYRTPHIVEGLQANHRKRSGRTRAKG